MIRDDKPNDGEPNFKFRPPVLRPRHRQCELCFSDFIALAPAGSPSVDARDSFLFGCRTELSSCELMAAFAPTPGSACVVVFVFRCVYRELD